MNHPKQIRVRINADQCSCKEENEFGEKPFVSIFDLERKAEKDWQIAEKNRRTFKIQNLEWGNNGKRKIVIEEKGIEVIPLEGAVFEAEIVEEGVVKITGVI